MASKSFHAIIAGVGSGTGRSVAIRFAKAYTVVLLARKPESYSDIVKEIEQSGGRAIGITTDVADVNSLQSAFDTVKKELPGSKLAASVFNPGGGFARKPFLELTVEDFNDSIAIAGRGFFHFAQKSLPLLLESVPDSPLPPSLIVSGATASIRGSANFATFAAGKFALRALTQSAAREFGPKGVHVAHVILDGPIDIPRLKHIVFNNGVEDGKMKPDGIAESYWNLHAQHRSTFTAELDLRPYVEKF